MCLTLVALEFGFRALIFSNLKWGKPFRNPFTYFDFHTDEFWYLNYRWGQPFGRAIAANNPILGWDAGKLQRGTFLHVDIAHLGKRRPVLLYGDSFAQCTTKKCFEQYFNDDPVFAKNCYFLNYGIGASGIDQTYLTFHHSIGHFKHPLVIYSLLDEDLDRALLKVFTMEKPYFLLEGDKLVLRGVPVDPDPKHYFGQHPPHVISYLYLALSRAIFRRFYRLTPLKERPRVRRLSRAILRQAILELRSRRVDFFFLIFLPNAPEDFAPAADDWRTKTIVSILREEHVPYLQAKDLLLPVLRSRHLELKNLFGRDSHPNDLQNEIIANGLKRMLAPCFAKGPAQ